MAMDLMGREKHVWCEGQLDRMMAETHVVRQRLDASANYSSLAVFTFYIF